MVGQIYNIQRYSLHDGPGIRTTVFLKGCPLSCAWCHNPESQQLSPQLMVNPTLCMGCHECVKGCETGALLAADKQMKVIDNQCILCGACQKACPAGAIEIIGKGYTLEQVVSEVLKDRTFYDSSGGGVTLSGGEPLQQWTFALALVKALKKEKIHITLDTSGHEQWAHLEPFLGLVDLYLYDVKHMDPDRHRRWTGVDNLRILDNLERLMDQGEKIWIRLPLIPGINDQEDHLHDLAAFVSRGQGVDKVCLLPYHGFAAGKYDQLGMVYDMKDKKKPGPDRILASKALLEGYGLEVQVGG